ncbi:hypothetical protein [Mesorhizobium sp. CN2-181]|uniref:hypothetical protein n=1 Tax=Mesorhizobium yinganensis TaxID=3157707 RepID=UPI0032B84702
MPKFITIGCGDEAGYERTARSVRDAAHAHDEELKRKGALIGIAGRPKSGTMMRQASKISRALSYQLRYR